MRQANPIKSRLPAIFTDLLLVSLLPLWHKGYLLRILEYIGAYDGSKIDKDRLLTALRVLCFIGYFSDDRNGSILSFKGGALMIPYDDVVRLERFVRTAV